MSPINIPKRGLYKKGSFDCLRPACNEHFYCCYWRFTDGKFMKESGKLFTTELTRNSRTPTINSRPADTSLLQTPRHCEQGPAPRRNAYRNDWSKLPLLQTRKCDTFMLPVRNFPCFFSCYSGHYVQILTHVIKSEIKIKENKETLSSIGCEYENFLLVARSFSGSWGHVKNFMFAY